MQSKNLSKKDPNLSKIVVVGGGTGTFVVLSGLKDEAIDLTAIITVADSGGSTGRLRDEFGFQPVGDLRQSLAALATEDHQTWIRDLLLYRFTIGGELKGHNLGNLILTALQDMGGSTPKALEIAGKIFRLKGHIFPSTLSNVQLVIDYADGSQLVGEHHLDNKAQGGKKIKAVSLRPQAKIYSASAAAITSAHLVIIGPGDLYASLLPNLVVIGASAAFQQTSAKIVYVINLMTRYTQTHDMTASDHLAELTRYLGRTPDIVILNTGPIPQDILASYTAEHEFPVKDDLSPAHNRDSGPVDQPKIIRGDFVSYKSIPQAPADSIQRSLLRHDRDKLTQAIMNLL